MIVAIDIETAPNADVAHMMPPPDVKLGNLVDTNKIKAKVDAATAVQREKMGLDPMTGRVIAVAFVGQGPKGAINGVKVAEAMTDEAETDLVEDTMKVLAKSDIKIVTWNGIDFDMPYLYKRALILGIDADDIGFPPLSTWTKRYKCDRHYDLMKVWSGWRTGNYTSLETFARLVLNDNKGDVDYSTFVELMKTEEGRAQIGAHCQHHTALTYTAFERMLGYLFI